MESILKIFLLLSLVMLTVTIQAAELNKEERAKRKIVSRMYQVSERVLARCPKKDKNDFEESLMKFKKTYPEFISLVENSVYRKYAIDTYSDDAKKRKAKTAEDLSRECLYIKSLLDDMLTTEHGKKSVESMVEILKK